MNWTNENTLKFLELYKQYPCIWDPKNVYHKNKNKIKDAWLNIQQLMGESCDIAELKKKKESLMSAYRGYITKVVVTEGVYKPTWFAYKSMNSFLNGIYKCSASKNIGSEVDSESKHGLDEEDEGHISSEADPIGSDTFPAQSVSESQTLREKKTQKNLQNTIVEMQKVNKQMNETHKILKRHSDDDECGVFGILIAKKMRKLPEDRRDLMMIRICQLFYEERQILEAKQLHVEEYIVPVKEMAEDNSCPEARNDEEQ